jgi:hypothetical protein
MEQVREQNIPKRNWFEGWYIGSRFYKATTQAEADTYQLEYELRIYFRNINNNNYMGDGETDDDSEDETDVETDDEEEP